MRSARDPAQAFQYLKATNDGRTPDDVLQVLAAGMCEVESYVRELGRINNAAIANSVEENALREKSGDPYRRQIRANYPLPGTDTFYHTTAMDIPGFDARVAYPWANGAPGGPRLFRIVHEHLLKQNVEIRLATPAVQLIADPATREVRGLRVSARSEERRVGKECVTQCRSRWSPYH